MYTHTGTSSHSAHHCALPFCHCSHLQFSAVLILTTYLQQLASANTECESKRVGEKQPLPLKLSACYLEAP